MESLVISSAFLARPPIDLCNKCAHGAIIERRANIIHALPPVLDAIPPALYDLVTCRGKADDQDGWVDEG